MSAVAVRLKIRIQITNRPRAYVDPVFAGNGKLKPLFGVVNGKQEHHPEGVYSLRYLKGGKRVWHAVGSDPQVALTAKLRVEHGLQAAALGVRSDEPLLKEASGKTGLTEIIAEYLADTKRGKAKNTFYAYARTLRYAMGM